MGILIAFGMMGTLGVVIGVALAVASKVFYVYVDPTVEAIEGVLPGANCGGCGLPGCSANAEAIATGKAGPGSCVAGGADLAAAIAQILGVSVEAKEPDFALPGCTYGVQVADIKYIYDGLNDCRAVALLNGGMKECNIGCLGLGTCVKACPFDALSMGEDNLPKVDQEKCTGCGTCERVCPKHIINLSSVTRRILKEYTENDCTTPCQRACPAGINISEYIHQITLGDYSRAVQVIKERNPFPTVIGRICPRPCEFECRRKHVDEPVAINFLKRFAADYEREKGQRILPYKAPDTGRKIAVIGGGVQGLSTAFFSARLGHTATVFESTAILGGLLRTAIDKNRLPSDILDWDIAGVKEMGVDMQTEKTLGKDFTLSSLLKNGFEAVFLATGGWDSRLARGAFAKVETIVPGTYLMIDVVKHPEMIAEKGNAVIIGGGPLAAGAANVLKDKGCKNITLILPEGEAHSMLKEEDMEQLKQKGVHIVFNSRVVRTLGHDQVLDQVEIQNIKTNQVDTVSAGILVLAAGRMPEWIFAKQDNQDEKVAQNPDGPVAWQAREALKNPENFKEKGVLSPADPVTDFSAAIRAIGAGRRAAASIHQVIYGIELDLPEKVVSSRSIIQNVYDVKNVESTKRTLMPLSSSADLARGMELEQGFSEDKARNEAKRCLRCGLICYQKNQITDLVVNSDSAA